MVLLPIFLICGKLSVIAVKAGLSGIPGQPITYLFKHPRVTRKINRINRKYPYLHESGEYHDSIGFVEALLHRSITSVPMHYLCLHGVPRLDRLLGMWVTSGFASINDFKEISPNQIPFMECSAPKEFSGPQRNCTFMNWNSSLLKGPPRRNGSCLSENSMLTGNDALLVLCT